MGLRMRGLRITMYAWGGLMLVSGLVAMLFPGRIEAFAGKGATNTFLLGSWGWLEALLGLGVMMAGRDPIRHILWVRLAGINFGVSGAYDVLHYLAGTITLGVVALDLVAYAVFGLLFLAFYPRAPRMVPLGVHSTRGTLYTDIDRGGLFIRRGGIWLSYTLLAQEAPVPVGAVVTAPEAAAPSNGASAALPAAPSDTIHSPKPVSEPTVAALPKIHSEATEHQESR